ncbi:Placenta growth factor [Anabarilius grahami]|uniref:Placenta growth factor n=1 Tax=Anabarilius grahami TaxID=495550 RepID=A0A3N0Z0X7_ANAGA|nr:Placenta growth factor [Anabarilius grahami]
MEEKKPEGGRKRNTFFEVAEKRRKLSEERNLTRVVLGETFQHWRAMKEQRGVKTDAQFSKNSSRQSSSLVNVNSTKVMLFQEVWGKSFCRTIEKLVEVVQEYPGEVEHIFSPACVPLVRCAGCCGDENLECHPTLTSNTTMQPETITQSIPDQGADDCLIDLWATDPVPSQVPTLELTLFPPVPSSCLDAPVLSGVPPDFLVPFSFAGSIQSPRCTGFTCVFLLLCSSAPLLCSHC